jgi:20S proteasome alpha/beta subunit
MTVIVGILCSDGVVIGSDSAMAVGRALSGYSVERDDGGLLKIEVIDNNVITAVTGAMGLAQRFNEKITTTIRELRQPFQPPQQFLALAS